MAFPFSDKKPDPYGEESEELGAAGSAAQTKEKLSVGS